ncbi:MAG: hypothetical protein K8I60_06865 [Anaerolineae bacterium]|nr:hypothetical protein [Anaerolineae bacterium]
MSQFYWLIFYSSPVDRLLSGVSGITDATYGYLIPVPKGGNTTPEDDWSRPPAA